MTNYKEHIKTGISGFFRQDLKRSILNPGFFAGIIFVFAILLPPAVFDTPLNGSRSYLHGFGNVFHASGFSPFAAVFPVLAYASVYCEEHGSGYLCMILQRTGFVRFIKVRAATVACSGGLLVALPVTVVCLIVYIGGAPGLPAGTDAEILSGSKILEAIVTYGDWYVIAGKAVLAFLFGALWALVGFAFAVWIPNRYVSLLAPFILYDTLWLFIGFQSYNPAYLLSGDDVGHGYYPLAVLIDLLYIAAAVSVICAGIKRERKA